MNFTRNLSDLPVYVLNQTDDFLPDTCSTGVYSIVQYSLTIASMVVLLISTFIMINKFYDFSVIVRSFFVMCMITIITTICLSLIIIFWVNPQSFLDESYTPMAIIASGVCVIVICLITIMVYMCKFLRDDRVSKIFWLILSLDCIITLLLAVLLLLVNIYCTGKSQIYSIQNLNYTIVELAAASAMLLFGILLSLKVLHICFNIRKIDETY